MERLKWSATYLDGETSRRRSAWVTLRHEGLSIQPDDGGRILWPWPEVRQTQGEFSGEPIRLERPERSFEALLVEDPAFVRAVNDYRGPQGDRLRAPWSRKMWVAWIAGAAVVSVGWMAFLGLKGLPLFSHAVAQVVPVAWEEQLGGSVLDAMVPVDQRCRDPKLQQALTLLSHRLAGSLKASPYRFQVVVWDNPGVNAFALPGGDIAVLRGLLEKTRRPEELAGVLAHEMQHVVHRHSTELLIRSLSTRALLTAAAGRTQWVMSGGELVTGLHQARAAEAQADRDGMATVRAAGLDPSGMVAIYQSLADLGTVPRALSFLSDHPQMTARIDELTKLEGKPAPSRPPLALSEPWSKTVQRCH